MDGDATRARTDRSCLQNVQYRTDANLAARQSVYGCQHPRIDLPAAVLDLPGLRGAETVADVGCGNGAYLAELATRGHSGPVLGMDLSPGMLRAALSRAPRASVAAADAAALPVADGACDLALAAHMLYHVPDPRAAVRELRRITRDGGHVLVVLNGEDHLRELRDAMAAALGGTPAGERVAQGERLRLDHGADLLAAEFRSVTRHDFAAELVIPGPAPVENYVRSMITTQEHRAGRLGGVAMPVRTPQQLIGDLRLRSGGAADDQPAITDEVAFVTAPDGQQGDPRCRRCRELLGDKCPGVFSRRRSVAAFGVKGTELTGVQLGPWLQPQPLGLKVEGHRLVRRHGPTLHHGSCWVAAAMVRKAAEY